MPRQKDEDLLLYAEKRSKAESSLDRIRKHYISAEKYPLSESDTRIHKRLEFAYNKYMAGFLKDEIKKLLMDAFGISHVQAINDIENAMFLFGDIHKSKKNMARHFVTESAREMHRMALAKQDYKSALKALEIITKTECLDKTDEDGDIEEKIKPVQVNLNFDPIALAMMQQMVNQGVVNLNEFMANKAEEVEFEDVTKESDEDDN